MKLSGAGFRVGSKCTVLLNHQLLFIAAPRQNNPLTFRSGFAILLHEEVRRSLVGLLDFKSNKVV